MKISLNTLKKYIGVGLPQITDLVELINQQLGGVEEVIDLGAKYKNIVIAKVVSCEPHPDSDHLHICQIEVGNNPEYSKFKIPDSNFVQVVCGAPNVHADMFVAWLPPGATVPASFDTSDPFVLGARELRGVKSNGMLASPAELAIGDNHEGILEITEKDLSPAVALPLEPGQDFSDSYERGGSLSVKMARTFVTNYFKGERVSTKDFNLTDTTPVVCPTGTSDPEWEKLKTDNPDLWTHSKLLEAAKEFSGLVNAQRNSFKGKQSPKPKPDYPEKALNVAVLSAWAYTAGVLQGNATRLKRHFNIRTATGKDPLNADALAKGRHKTDPQNYRGLGYRTDPQERGRFVERFYLQAEEGSGITPSAIDIAIKQFHVKQAQLDVLKAKAKAKG